MRPADCERNDMIEFDISTGEDTPAEIAGALVASNDHFPPDPFDRWRPLPSGATQHLAISNQVGIFGSPGALVNEQCLSVTRQVGALLARRSDASHATPFTVKVTGWLHDAALAAPLL
jgi:hypothetical protein